MPVDITSEEAMVKAMTQMVDSIKESFPKDIGITLVITDSTPEGQPLVSFSSNMPPDHVKLSMRVMLQSLEELIVHGPAAGQLVH